MGRLGVASRVGGLGPDPEPVVRSGARVFLQPRSGRVAGRDGASEQPRGSV